MTAKSGIIHVFTGPTLNSQQVVDVLPESCVHPPIRHGDLDDHIAPGDTAAIIDGLFYQAPSIRHKEIISALRRGVRVVGASSMGALRASELDKYGMQGTGLVYSMFASGQLDDDGEVAVLHAGKDEAWKPLTVALVSMRVALAELARQQVVTRAQEHRALAAVQELPFPQRSSTGIKKTLAEAGLPDTVYISLGNYLAQADVKVTDARALLEEIRANHFGDVPLPAKCGPFCEIECGCEVTHFQAEWEWKGISLIGGVRQLDLVSAAQALLPAFPGIYRRTALKVITGAPAAGPLDETAAQHDALEAAVSRGVMHVDWRERPLPPQTFKSFLRSVEHYEWQSDPAQRSELAVRALVRSCRVAPGPPPVHLTTAEIGDGDLVMLSERVLDADRHNTDQMAADMRQTPHRVKRSVAEEFLRNEWQGPVDVQAAMDRGFMSLDQALRTARRFAPLWLSSGVARRDEPSAESIPGVGSCDPAR
jgi:hypothetical protein